MRRRSSYLTVGDVFVGRDAVAAGHMTRRELAAHYRPILRGVYLPAEVEPTLADRLAAVSLVAPAAVIGGIAASALHGARWVDPDVPIEVIMTGRAQRGLVVRRDSLTPDETTTVAGIRVTALARTAYDLARQLPRDHAVARLDALMAARPFSIEDVQLLAKQHAGARGLRRLRAALPLIDGGAASPRETRLRLLLSMPVYRGPAHKSLCSTSAAASCADSIWAGSNSWWRSSTTGTSTAPIGPSTSRISALDPS